MHLSIYRHLSINLSINLSICLYLILHFIFSLFYRLIPFRSIYVPNLAKAFGFNLVDIVLEFTFPEGAFINANVRREKNIPYRNRDNNCKKVIASSCVKKSSNRDYRKSVYTDSTKDDDDNFHLAGHNKKINYPLVYQMKDSECSTVKFEFYDDEQYQNLIDRFTAEDRFAFPSTVQIFFKSVLVKSVFSDRVTKLKATPDSDFIFQKYQHFHSDLVSEIFKFSL